METVHCVKCTNLLKNYSWTSASGHLSTMTTFFGTSGQKIVTLTLVWNLTTTTSSLQLPLSSVPKVAIVERFNRIQTCLVTGSCCLEFQLTVSSATVATHLMKFDPKFSALLRIPVVINTNKPPPKPIKEIQSFSSTKRKRTHKGQ